MMTLLYVLQYITKNVSLFNVLGEVFLCSQKTSIKFVITQRRLYNEGRGKPFQVSTPQFPSITSKFLFFVDFLSEANT